MKYAFDRHVHISYLWHHGHFYGCEENALCGLAYPGVFLRGYAYDGGGIDGIFAVRDGGDMESRIKIGQGVVAGMVAEGAFPNEVFGGIHVAFYDKVGI